MEFRKIKEGESPFPKMGWQEKLKFRMVSEWGQWIWGAYLWILITLAAIPFLTLDDIIPYTATLTTVSLALWSYTDYKRKNYLDEYADELRKLHYRMKDAEDNGWLNEEGRYVIGEESRNVKIKKHTGLAEFLLTIHQDRRTKKKWMSDSFTDVIVANPILRDDLHVRMYNYMEAIHIIKTSKGETLDSESIDDINEIFKEAFDIQKQSYIKAHLGRVLKINVNLYSLAHVWKIGIVGFIWAIVIAFGYIFKF